MKRNLCLILSLIFLLTPVLSACSSDLSLPEETEEKKVDNKKEETKKTEETEETAEAADPAEDDVMRILMIGNSFCYYFPDELYGLAEAAGIKMQVCNVYYSGCRLQWHWEWLLQNEAKYQYFSYDESGRTQKPQTADGKYTLKQCLAEEAWDVITLQQHFGPQTAGSYEDCYKSCNPYGEKLLDFLKKQYPKAQFYFQQTWAYQVGYSKENGTITDSAMQQNHHENIRRACLQLCEDLSLARIPSGDAWHLARNNPAIGDILCNKGPGGDSTKGDFYHEGTTGGGQYLNACVWFEVLTGKSVIGNTFRPADYDLDETRAVLLQQIAHQAVADMNA